MILFKKSYARFVASRGRFQTVQERLAFDAGRRFRIRHGACPHWLNPDKRSDDWNGDAPYAKHLRIPTKRGFEALRWRKRQVLREAWEIGWAYQNSLMD